MLFHTELLYLLKITDKNKIMILTGRAKQNFYKYLNIEDYKLFDYVRKKYANEIVLNALIIEWFDSIPYENSTFWEYCFEYEYSNSIKSFKEITIKAIKKANEIYNNTL